MKGFGLIAIATGAYLIWQGKRKVDSMQYMNITIRSIKPDFTHLLAPRFNITLDLFNPNDAPVPITAIYGIVGDNSGNKLASFSTSKKNTLAGGESTVVPVTLVINGLNTLNFFKNAFLNKKLFNFKLDGVAKTAFYDQKFSETIILGS